MTTGELPLLFGRPIRHIHAVGIGGMGMGPLAIFLAELGWIVTGEDTDVSPRMLQHLRQAGIEITAKGQLPADADMVVCSSAIPATHPTRSLAAEKGLSDVRRGELLADVSRKYRVVGIAGSHGKTTVTAMLISVLRNAENLTNYVLGGLFDQDDWAPAAVGSNGWLVIEIDESDGTIDGFSPEITVVVNLDWDHADRYGDMAAIEDAFAGLIERTSAAALRWDTCAATKRVFDRAEPNVTQKTFGRNGDFRLLNTRPTDSGICLSLGGEFKSIEMPVQARGEFNALNATAALAAAQLMGGESIGAGLETFPGVHRRQTQLHKSSSLRVVEDYAHHPTEIGRLLESLRGEVAEGGRLVVVFQPHRFTRTKQFKRELAKVLLLSDSLHLLEVYGAGETAVDGGTTGDLVDEIRMQAPQFFINYVEGNTAHVMTLLRQSSRPGDFVVFVGAGDIEHVARQWVQEVEAEQQRSDEWDALQENLQNVLSAGTKITRREILASKTTMRIGGAAQVYVEPIHVADLQTVLAETARRSIRPFVLGRGSNLLVPDAGVDGVVISLRRTEWESFEILDDGRVRVGAGLRLKNLCGLATKAGLSGFEFLEGIPGNVGGALRMNAGAMGGWMFDVVEEVEALTSTGELRNFKKSDMHYGYRHCTELQDNIAVGAVLKPNAVSESDLVGRQIDVYRSKRQESQPREPSAGCIFKNPEGDSAGRLIEASGLKGERIGDAEVSSVHGNFMVNRGRATSGEVVALVRRVRAEVKCQTGTVLQPEVLLYGGNWEDLL